MPVCSARLEVHNGYEYDEAVRVLKAARVVSARLREVFDEPCWPVPVDEVSIHSGVLQGDFSDERSQVARILGAAWIVSARLREAFDEHAERAEASRSEAAAVAEEACSKAEAERKAAETARIRGEEAVAEAPRVEEEQAEASRNKAAEEAAAAEEARIKAEEERKAQKNKCECQFFVGIKEKKFSVKDALIGKGGQHIQDIEQAAGPGTEVCLRGRGSGYEEGPQQRESRDELILCISAPSKESCFIAKQRVSTLLDGIYQDYAKKTNLAPPCLRFHDGPAAHQQ
jgi:hypothetical protein